MKKRSCLAKIAVMCMSFSLVVDSGYAKAESLQIPVEDSIDGGKILEKAYESTSATNAEIKEMKSNSISPQTEEAILSINEDLGGLDVGTENPKKYAGMYLDSKENIVVNTTDKNNAILNKVEESADGEKVKIKKVKYSLNQLKEEMKKIEEYYESNWDIAQGKEKEILEDIQGFHIDVEKNAVVITIKNDDANKEKHLKDYAALDDEKIMFENAKHENELTSMLSAGQTIATDLQNGYCGIYSIGYRAWWLNSDGSTSYGFVTAAHGNSAGRKVYTSTYIYDKNNYVGYVCKLAYGGSVDAALVLVNGSHTISNHLYGSSLALTDRYYYPSFWNGMTVGKIGQTTGYTSGTVTNASSSVAYEGIVFNDFLETTNHVEGGDSGGIAFTYESATNIMAIDGITAATNGVKSYFVKYSNINQALGANAY